jgi:uncharacterized membrane protein
MKYSDIAKLREAGLISAEQQEQISQHFSLREDENRLLMVFSVVGALLGICGIALLIAANWQQIPRGIKIATGLMLMLGAHAGGWQLRERKDYEKTGDALHFLGSGLFLANIALIGQIYHISTRPPNAILLWWVGIAALPWILRSRMQHILTLVAFGVWFGMEINQEGSPLYFGEDESQILLYALLGLAYLGFGYCLRRTSFESFAKVTQKLGLLVFLISIYPTTWTRLYRRPYGDVAMCPWILPVLAAVAGLLLIVGISRASELPAKWRRAWGVALLGMIGVILFAQYYPSPIDYSADHRTLGFHSFCAMALFAFCLMQVQAGIVERSPYLLNLAVAFILLNILATYISLFGSMGQTGLIFLIGGAVLFGCGIFLERKRRALMKQFKQQGA